MTRLSRPELAALTADLYADTDAVLEADGPRNAAAYWNAARTAQRFRDTPHAFPAPPELPEAFPTAYSVMEAYRAQLPSALERLERSPADPVAADAAYFAMAQYAAAVDSFSAQTARAVSVLFHHLEEVTQRCAQS